MNKRINAKTTVNAMIIKLLREYLVLFEILHNFSLLVK